LRTGASTPRTGTSGGPRSNTWKVCCRPWCGSTSGRSWCRRARTGPAPGAPPPAEPWAADVVPLLPFELRGAKLYLPGATPTLGGRADEAIALAEELAAAGFRATPVEDAELARFLEASGTLVRLGERHAIGAENYERARQLALEEARAAGELTLGRFRDLLGTGRRDAQLLLERFDRDGLTRRVGDRRVLRLGASSPGDGRSPAGRAG